MLLSFLLQTIIIVTIIIIIIFLLLNCSCLNAWVSLLLPFQFSPSSQWGREWASSCALLSCQLGLNKNTTFKVSSESLLQLKMCFFAHCYDHSGEWYKSSFLFYIQKCCKGIVKHTKFLRSIKWEMTVFQRRVFHNFS